MKYLFFLFVFIVWLAALAYSVLRINQIFDSYVVLRRISTATYVLLFVAFIVSVFFEGYLPLALAKPISFVGYSFLVLSVYLLITFLLVDGVRLVNHFWSFTANIEKIRMWLSLCMMIVTIVAMIVGNIRFNNPKIVELNIQSSKERQNKELKVVVASDIHLGVSIDKKRLQTYVELINNQQPDLVLIAGDLIDRLLHPVVNQKMDEELRQIKAPMGVYAILGNHEYYGEGLTEVKDFFDKGNIQLLQDSSVLIDEGVYIVGRDDKTNPNRKGIDDLVQNLEKSKPVILLDHQPYELQEAVQNNIDIQFSGHTHNGQFFPINLIVKGLFEKGYGYLKKDGTHVYVTSGLGLWGPQYRIGSQSEIVILNLKY